MLTVETLKKILHYDPATGIFTWRGGHPKVRSGQIAGGVSEHGYLKIRVYGRKYYAGPLAWFYVHGEWPGAEIDHKNLDKLDNRIENLRLATRAQNVRNVGVRKDSSSGIKGVYWHSQSRKWRAQIRVDNSVIYLGSSHDKFEAGRLYRSAVEKYHGEFGRAA